MKMEDNDVEIKTYWTVWFDDRYNEPIRYRPKGSEYNWSTCIDGAMPIDYRLHDVGKPIPPEVLAEIARLREKHRPPIKREFTCIIKDVDLDDGFDMRVVGVSTGSIKDNGEFMRLCTNRSYVKVTVEEIKD